MSILQDLHYGWRNLIRTPGFLVVAVLSLALGIGANTSLFSLIYGALYKTLPVTEPERLVLLNDPGAMGMGVGSSGGERGLMTWPEFQDLHRVDAFQSLFAAESMAPKLHVRVGNNPEEAHGKMVSGSYFETLGLRPQAGRFFSPETDTQLGAAPYVVLSDGYWSRRFGRSPAAIGQIITIQKTPFTIVGVGPRGFSGENVGQNPDFWTPLSMQMQIMPGIDTLHPMPDPSLKVMWLHVFARLKPGVNIARAQTQTDTVFKANLEESYRLLSPSVKKNFMNQFLKLRPASTGSSGLRSKFSESMYVIFAAVAATLLISCANLSNLLLARSNARQREITVRLALGATKSRVARQLFTEGLLLSSIGAFLGLLISQGATPLLLRMASSGDEVIHLETGIDWRILLFTGAVAIATTVICSLIPAIRAARAELIAALRKGARGMTASRGRLTAGRAFAATQVALSLILLVGAGLFLRTLVNLEGVDVGYAKDRLALVDVDMSSADYKPEVRAQSFRRVLERLRATPGVQSVTFSQNGLFGNSESGDQISVEGYTPTGKDDKGSRFDMVGPGYFSSLSIPLLLGRELDERDNPNSTTVCVINDAFAKQFFANRNPLGKHIISVFGDKRVTYEVAGVAKDSRDHSLRDKVPPRVFVSFLQAKYGEEVSRFAEYEVRMAGDGGAALPLLKSAVLAADHNLDVETHFLSRSIEEHVSQERLVANLVSLFGALALALASVGIYGILAYGVSQRTNEIGLRMAIGAGSGDVVRMIARETAGMISAGLLMGLVAAYFLTRLVESKLFGVTATDPLVAISSIVLLATVGFLAATLPALRASRIDPASALRNE